MNNDVYEHGRVKIALTMPRVAVGVVKQDENEEEEKKRWDVD